MCYNVIRTDVYTDTGEVIGSAVVGSFCTGAWGGYHSTGGRGGRSGSRHTGNEVDPCAHLVPATIPPGVSVDEVMREAKEIYNDTAAGISDLGATGARAAVPFTIYGDFYRRVKSGGPWDYKLLDQEGIRQNGRSKYEEFGNFIYGVTGSALGIPSGVLFRGAGYAQQQDPNPDVRAQGEDVAVIGWSKIFSSEETYPYGDERQDAEAIQRGIDYAACRRSHPR